MSKSIKLKNNTYWDSAGIVDNKKPLNIKLNEKGMNQETYTMLNWQKICNIKFDAHSQGEFVFVKLFIGNGQNGYANQNAYIDIIMQLGWTGENDGRAGCFAQLYSLGTIYTTSNTQLKIIANSNIDYDIWFYENVTEYCKPNYTANASNGVTITKKFTNSSNAPTGTECDLLYKQIDDITISNVAPTANEKVWFKHSKNFLNYKIPSITNLGLNISMDGSELEMNGTTSESGFVYSTSDNLFFVKKGTYVLSGKKLSGTYTRPQSGADLGVYISSQTGETSYITLNMANDYNSSGVVTFNDDTFIKITLYTNGEGIIFNNLIIGIQIELGNSLTSYEPYIEDKMLILNANNNYEEFKFDKNTAFHDTTGNDWKEMLRNKLEYAKSQFTEVRETIFINGGWNGNNFGYGFASRIGNEYQLSWFSTYGIYYIIQHGDGTYNYRTLLSGNSDSQFDFDKKVILPNNTWNEMGDDCYFGDINVGGKIGLLGKSGDTGVRFINNSNDSNYFDIDTDSNNRLNLKGNVGIYGTLDGNSIFGTTFGRNRQESTLEVGETKYVRLSNNICGLVSLRLTAPYTEIIRLWGICHTNFYASSQNLLCEHNYLDSTGSASVEIVQDPYDGGYKSIKITNTGSLALTCICSELNIL